MAKYTFLSLAKDVLSTTKDAMTPEDIWQKGQELGLADAVGSIGKTPWRSIQAQLYVDIREKGANSAFVQTRRSPVAFGLARYCDPITKEPQYTIGDLIIDAFAQIREPLTPEELAENAVSLGFVDKLGGKLNIKSLKTALNKLSREDGPIRKVSTKPVRYVCKQDERPAAQEKAAPPSAAKPDVKPQRARRDERNLHKLLTTFVKADSHFKCYTKTIYHESSRKGSSGADKWSYPDLVGAYYPFDEFKTSTVNLMETMRDVPFKIFSFELKWHLDTSNLRECYFQAVSNSSWAHEGYLVSPSISKNVDFLDDLRRLVNAFGIGVISLNIDNIEQSEVLFAAQAHDRLDWATVDRLVANNRNFEDFIKDVHADAKTNGVRGGYDPSLTPDEYSAYVAEKVLPYLTER